MAAVVEHEKRKRAILEKAFELFVEDGYADVTYQKIADRCGFTRTTLYSYFRNKQEIFLWSIKQLSQSVESRLNAIIADDSLDSITCLKQMLLYLIDCAEKNRDFFKVLKMYLMQIEKRGGDVYVKVARRVIRLQHLLTRVIVRGQKSGEIKMLPIRQMNALMFDLLESVFFKLAIINRDNLDSVRESAVFVIDFFKSE